MDKVMKNKKGLELVASLSFSCKNMFRKIRFMFWPFEFGSWKKNKKVKKMTKYLKNEKSFLQGIKTIFHNFWNAFFW